jgi:hypothetical protein
MFHLLIGEATANWAAFQWRPLLGRVFEHGKMKSACEKVPGVNVKQRKGSSKLPFENRTPADHLRVFAEAFIQAQEFRELADYDMSTTWEFHDAAVQIDLVADAFRSWKIVREGPEAQKLLVMMFGPKQRASRV